MSIQSILDRKHGCTLKICYEASVKQAADLLRNRSTAALVVSRGEEIVGIVSERDIVIALSRFGEPALYMPVGAVVGQEMVVAISPDSRARAAMSLMMQYRVRHLLVIDKGTSVGILSISDLVPHCLDDLGLGQNALPDARLVTQ